MSTCEDQRFFIVISFEWRTGVVEALETILDATDAPHQTTERLFDDSNGIEI